MKIRNLLLLFLISFAFLSVSAQEVVITKKVSEPYSGPIDCVFNKKKGRVEVANRFDYLEVRRGNKVTKITPVPVQPNMMYIWVALSPNGKMIMFNEPKTGTFICDLEGKVLYDLGHINAANWFDNKHVIGVYSKDDGHRFLESRIKMVDIKSGKKMDVNTDEIVSAYPFAKKPYIIYYSGKTKHTIKIKVKK